MRKEAVEEALLLAQTFIDRGGKLTKRDYFSDGTKRTAALRRASMELTRALTEMRKP